LIDKGRNKAKTQCQRKSSTTLAEFLRTGRRLRLVHEVTVKFVVEENNLD